MRAAMILMLVWLGVSGCTSVSDAGYYWGNHSEAYYRWVKAPSEETLAAYVEELQEIIRRSEERDLRVPPGVHAELGFLMAKLNGETDTAAFYAAEISTYPESRVLLQRLQGMEVAP